MNVRLLPIVAVVGLMLLAGCGESTYSVSGQVRTADGESLSGGQIEFQHVDRQLSAVGYLDEEGRFMLGTDAVDDGVFAGLYRVAIKPPALPMLPPGEANRRIVEAAARDRQQWLDRVPTRYHSPATSGIEVEIEDSRELDIVVER